MADVQAPDGAVAGFVAACDRALELGRTLEGFYETNDDRRASQVRKVMGIVDVFLAQALDGTPRRPTADSPRLGLSRRVDEFDFHPDGREFTRSVRDIEEYWSREMGE